MEDDGLGAIEIFRLLLVHAACGEADDMPEAVMDLDDDTVLVEVIAATIEQAQLFKEVGLNGELL